MWIVGLTGSIGMGKSTAGSMLRRMGAVVCDSDAVVHGLFRRGGAAVEPIAARYPDAVVDGVVDRRALGAAVFGNAEALGWLERLIHPLVGEAQRRFVASAARRGVAITVLDIPLLFETRAERRLDAVLVVSAPAVIQRRRVMARPGMTAEKLNAILGRQMPDAEKRARGDFIIPTGRGRAVTWRCLRHAIDAIQARPARRWKPGWRKTRY